MGLGDSHFFFRPDSHQMPVSKKLGDGEQADERLDGLVMIPMLNDFPKKCLI
jgi:hypothetical protein